MKECMDSKRAVRLFRIIAVGALTILMALVSVCLAGLRINGTHSFPVGLYWAIAKRSEKGDLVFVDPPALPIFELARNRG
jgi:type IV secretory pathway protease TraF